MPEKVSKHMQENNTGQSIIAGSRVTLHFSLSFPEGDVIDSNFDASPATFIVGDGNLLPGFEQQLLGLLAGDETVVIVSAEQGFGPANLDNIQVFSRAEFAGIMAAGNNELEEGMVISFADAANGELPGVVKKLSEQQVTIDFNHPLAGRDILFRARIIEVINS